MSADDGDFRLTGQRPRAMLGLPGGLRWIARHDSWGFVSGHRFVDECRFGGWRHMHEFSYAGPGKTRVRDYVDTPVPAAVLRSTFVYRHRQLADDLAAHRTAAENGAAPMVIAIGGASGLVGATLSTFLTSGGHRVIRLVRRYARPR